MKYINFQKKNQKSVKLLSVLRGDKEDHYQEHLARYGK